MTLIARSGVGSVRAGYLPAGWVSLVHFRHDLDVGTEYHGPVLEENEQGIRIEVWGEPLTFLKANCAITRPVLAA